MSNEDRENTIDECHDRNLFSLRKNAEDDEKVGISMTAAASQLEYEKDNSSVGVEIVRDTIIFI